LLARLEDAILAALPGASLSLIPAGEGPQRCPWQLGQPGWSWHSSPRNILQGRQAPCRHAGTGARQSERKEFFPGSGESCIPHGAWRGWEQPASQQALGLRAALDSEPLGCFFFSSFRSSSGYFSLFPYKWRLARFLASGWHLFQGNICRLVRASGRSSQPALHAWLHGKKPSLPTDPSRSGRPQAPRHT